MRRTDDYFLDVSASSDQHLLVATAEQVYERVWRYDFSAPGFCVLDLGSRVDSRILRSWMVRLKEGLSEVGVRRGRLPFVYRSLGRFDQQATTKFHLDGAPEQALLMLGYEPSRVHSRLLLADYTRAAFDLGLTPQQFLEEFNPMYRRGEELLDRYVTELPQAPDGHFRIVFVNNSSLPFTEARTDPLGVLHKAEIINPTPTEPRIVNSTMLVTGETDEIGQQQQQDFVTTDEISQPAY